ncbi:MAG TPA: glycosyltransferase family 39 protein [Patescibacteria group bacterium]|nr:glycosyltransferase family 39 protein [Patescibacteria group bacterium]
MKNYLKKIKVFFPRLSPKLILGLILFLAAFLRLYGLNWDQGQHLHPDERFLTMVETALSLPQTFNEYLNPQTSPMNPHNRGYQFFVYGTFPLFLTKLAGELTNYSDYDQIHFIGRFLSALFDLSTILIIFKIGQRVFNTKAGILAAFLYSSMVLPLQLSHFFAVDTFLTFFLVLSFYFLVLLTTDFRLLTTATLGISFGFALACKISALFFGPVIVGGLLFILIKKSKQPIKICLGLITVLAFSALAFRLSQPSAFATASFGQWRINPQFVVNLKELRQYDNPETLFPPSIQWLATKPILFPLKNLIFWGVGLPLGITAVFSLLYAIAQLLNFSISVRGRTFKLEAKKFLYFLALFWILGIFFYQGSQFSKNMRYFLPIYPFLALLSADFLLKIIDLLRGKLSKRALFVSVSLFFSLFLIYPLSFMSIYAQPNTRMAASNWIYQNIPAGATLLNEEWDDPLPLNLPQENSSIYTQEYVFMYAPDTPEKWKKINSQLEKVDYIVLSSNRAYGSTMRLADRYPQTIAYYQSLFTGSGKFQKVAEFYSYPCLPHLGALSICFNDDDAEESFTVYDHPKVIIFKKASH